MARVIKEQEWIYDEETGREIREPMIIECDGCGAEIQLWDSWATACDNCPAEYNGSGQRLANRAHWGEETGEHPADLGRL